MKRNTRQAKVENFKRGREDSHVKHSSEVNQKVTTAFGNIDMVYDSDKKSFSGVV